MQDEDFSVHYGPLNVHRHPIQRLDFGAELRQSNDLRILKRGGLALRFWDGYFFRAAVHARGHGLLVGDLTRKNCVVCLIHREAIRRHHTADHGLAQAPGCADHDLAAPPVHRVRGEHDARCLCRNERLYHHGQAHDFLMNGVLHPVADRPRRPQRRPAAFDRVQHGLDAAHIEEGFLLTSERCIRQVLGGSRRPYCHRFIPSSKRGVGRFDGGGNISGHTPLGKERANLG